MKNYLPQDVIKVYVRKFSFLTAILLSALSAAAQEKKADNIYYILDSAAVPIKDRMWVIYEDGPYKFYDLKCPCLEHGLEPTLYFNKNKSELKKVERNDLKLLKTVTIIQLITELKRLVNEKHTVNQAEIYLLEPEKGYYTMRKVELYGKGKRNVSD